MATTIRIGWSKESEDGTEDNFTLKVRVFPGCPARGPSYASGGEPAEDPSVEVLEVREDASGLLRPDLLDEAQESLDCAEALERAGDEVEGQREAYWEAQDEARRERLDDTMAGVLGHDWRR